jgi:undecaprenyl-diphosphatase
VIAYLVSIVLGIVEGLTEFLPISSTAHLRIAEALAGVDLANGYWKMYTVVIQLGAVLSVLVIYGRRLIDYARSFPGGPEGNRSAARHPLTLIAIAFVTTAIPAFLLEKVISDRLESTRVIAAALIAGGVVMWMVDRLCTRPTVKSVDGMRPLGALWIGAVQILSAVFPGTSRSMSTIAAGQVIGLSRSAALDFSFLVSLPVMLAACGYAFLKSLKELGTNPAFLPGNLHANPWAVLAIGFVVSFLVALVVNRWFIAWVKSRGFAPFAFYRIVLGIGVLLWAMR